MFDPADFSDEPSPLDRRTLRRIDCQVEAGVTFRGDECASPCILLNVTDAGIKIGLSPRHSYPAKALIRVAQWNASYDAVVTWAYRENLGLYLLERSETGSPSSTLS